MTVARVDPHVGTTDLSAAIEGGCVRLWQHQGAYDRAYYEEVAGLLHGLLIRLDDRLPSRDVTLIAEFIDANELGLDP